jgi:hypothetical protein
VQKNERRCLDRFYGYGSDRVVNALSGHLTMALFQCENCGCVENTACAAQGFKPMAHLFNWEGLESLKGKMICSACGPTKYRDGKQTKFGVWHGRFSRTFLPMGMFKTNAVGNLEHIETGEVDYSRYVIKNS